MAGEAVLSIVFRELVSKLSSPILDEFGLLWGVKKEKQKLLSNLSRIKAVLEDAERQQIDLMADKDRLGKLKDVAYDAEDLVDEFLIEALRRKVENQGGMGRKVGNFFSPSNPLAFHFKIAHKMKELRKRFEELREENNNFQPLEGVARSQPQISTTREAASGEPDTGVIGRVDEKENLIDSLLYSGNEEILSVIPIVGMGGLGKTTLAQYGYNDERVVSHFNLKMWVYVSEDFDVGRILAKILESATESTPTDGSSKDLLITRIKENLSGKRYLLVLDDVWNEEYYKWEQLKTALKCGAIGSKILVTTRSDKVAEIMDALRRPRLRTLSEDESWTLFEKEAHPPAGFVSIGEEIVRKCGGVPLAIKTLGGMLRTERSEREWQSVRDGELGKQTNDEARILSLLRLSYDHLTSSLKQCFSYCAVIPKGRRFDKDELIKHWIAQGFIHYNAANELREEEGEKYFNALLQRSLFQVDEETDSYKMHDLIHDLLRSIAGKECFVVEASMMTDLTRHLALCNDETRHLALCDEDGAKNLDALKKCKTLRSMITYGYFRPIDINVCLSFRCLRVLDLSWRRSICFLPNSIDKLRHLRYFDISRTGITKLPETICNLHNLQTLRVIGTSLEKWPENMKRMISLRHIEFDRGDDFPLPKGMGKLTFLRTLPKSKFIIAKESGAQIEELKDLNLLWRNIHIGGLDNITNVGCAGEADLKAKKHVNSLKLSWSGDKTVAAEGNAKEVIEILEPHSNLKDLSVENYTGLEFPSWMTEKLTNLKKISLSSCKRCEQLPPLGQLDFLESLEIDTMDAVQYIVEFGGSHNYKDLFPSLKDLHLRNMPNLERWSSPQEDGDGDEQGRQRDKQVIFKCLRTLSIYNCPKLICLPKFLLPALEELKMNEVGCESIECSRSHSLKSVDLFDMPNLERWSLQEVDDDKDEQVTFGSLRTLRISKCQKLICPPQLLLPALEELEMREVGCEWIEFSTSKSLKKVKLDEMPNLERWSLHEADDGTPVIFHSLRTLRISKCPKLICLPQLLLPALEELEMKEVGCEWIEFSTSKSLKKVKLDKMPNLERWSPHEADDGTPVIFHSLRTLRISKCPKLICPPQLLLPALEELEMREVGCEWIEFSTSKFLKKVRLDKMPNLERWSPHEADDSTPVIFRSLRTLRISKCPKLICPPQLLLPALKELEMREVGCEWIEFSTSKSLKKVKLDEMPNLERWSPHEADDGTPVILCSLRTLRISKCPKLICPPQLLLPTLEELEIREVGCERIEFSTSKSLKKVELDEMPNLERWSPHEADDGTPVIFRSLCTLRISKCPKLICPPQLLLPALEELKMTEVGCEWIEFSTSKSLKKVEFTQMPNLERWSPQEGDDDEQVVFNSLVELVVKECPKMVRLPHFLPSLQNFTIYGDNEKLLGSVAKYTSLSKLDIGALLEVKHLPEELGQNHTSLSKLRIRNCPKLSSLSNQLENLPALKKLIIVRCNDLVLSLPNGLQQRRSLPLNSLEMLHIYGSCKKQSSLPGNGIVLPSLKELRIHSCENIESLSADMLKNLTKLTIKDSSKVWSSLVSLENLKSLEHLKIRECPGIVMMKLLESMENLTSLTSLSIENCPGMRSLPESIKTLTSLTDLTISKCLDMRSLPEGLQRLKNLKGLYIRQCPVLERRVQRNKGQDWHKVAHVPYIHITASQDTEEGEESSDQRPHLLLHSLKKLKLEKLLPLPSCCSSSPSSSSPPST